MRDEKERKKILIFNVNWIGDVLFSTAVIRNVRRNYPDSFIACAIPGRCYPILKGNPYLDDIIIFDEREHQKSALSKFRFIDSLRRKKFDTAFLLHGSFTRALICRLAGIPERVGYHTKKRGFLLTVPVVPVARDALHRIDYYLNIIEKAGLKVEDRYPDFFIDETDVNFVNDFLKRKSVAEKDFLVGINPGGNWMPKRWPADYWAILADKLISEFGAKVIVTGGYSDISLGHKIKGMMKEKAIIASGTFSIKQLGALCRRLDIFITADSGPLHIANAVGAKKIIALFGPTSPAITGPYPSKNTVILSKDIGCKIPCYRVDCKDNRCMKAITPEDVLQHIRD